MTTNTAQAVIEKAYVDSMKLPRGGAVSSAQLADGLERLQDIVNLEATMGLKLFLETEISVTLIGGQQLYSFRPGGSVSMTRPLRVKDVAYVDASGQSRPLIELARTDWAAQPARNELGSVTQFFQERLYDRLNLYVWNTPSTSVGALRVTLHAAAASLSLSLTTAFPPEWVMFLRWALASDLASGMPVEVIQRCDGKTMRAREALEDFDVETAATRLQPTYAQYSPSEFSS